jgi:spore germination protein YaaH
MQLYTDPGMKNKWVMCTIEARTPPADLNTNAPLSQISYANDLTQINKYCDRVRIMTYDQDSVDKTLNKAAGNSIYTPIADPKWDTAVVQLMEKSISPNKIELGVATYGYEYSVTPYANHTGYLYSLLWAFNPAYATQLAASLHITPMRDSAGELAFTYMPTSTPATVIAASAANAQLSGTEHYVTWSDSVAIAQKIELAKQLGIRGIAIFKLDGGEDQNIWNILPRQ